MAIRAKGRPDRRAHPRQRRPGRATARSCSTSTASAARDLGGSYHEVVGERRRPHPHRLRPGRERHPARPRRQPRVRAGPSSTRGSVINDVIRALGIDRRPRHQRRRRRRARHAAGRCAVDAAARRVSRGASAGRVARSSRSVCPLLTLAARQAARRPRACPATCSSTCCSWSSSAAVGGVGPALGGRHRRFARCQLVLHPADPPLHHRRGRERSRPGVFLVVALVVSSLVVQAAARSAESARARAEAEALALAAAGSPTGPIRCPPWSTGSARPSAWPRSPCSRPRDEGDGWDVVASAGSPVPSAPPDDGSSVPLHWRRTSWSCTAATSPPRTGGSSPRLRRADCRRPRAPRLEAEAATAAVLAEADELRTALLRAVSHDLRTPLASIKASVTSLLQRDVEWLPRPTPSSSRPSTRRPTGWTTWSPTCST